MSNQSVEVLVAWSLNAKVTAADIVDGLVVDHERAVRVLKRGVSGEDGVVWLNDGGGYLGRRVDTELKLALLAIVDRETLHQQSTETGTSTATEGVENEKALKTGAVVCDCANFIQDLINELLADGVVATRVVVGSILLSSDHLVGVEKAAVGTGANLVNNVGLQIAVDCTWHIFAVSCSKVSILYSLLMIHLESLDVPVSEKKVENPWSTSACFRSSVRYPSG